MEEQVVCRVPVRIEIGTPDPFELPLDACEGVPEIGACIAVNAIVRAGLIGADIPAPGAETIGIPLGAVPEGAAPPSPGMNKRQVRAVDASPVRCREFQAPGVHAQSQLTAERQDEAVEIAEEMLLLLPAVCHESEPKPFETPCDLFVPGLDI